MEPWEAAIVCMFFLFISSSLFAHIIDRYGIRAFPGPRINGSGQIPPRFINHHLQTFRFLPIHRRNSNHSRERNTHHETRNNCQSPWNRAWLTMILSSTPLPASLPLLFLLPRLFLHLRRSKAENVCRELESCKEQCIEWRSHNGFVTKKILISLQPMHTHNRGMLTLNFVI